MAHIHCRNQSLPPAVLGHIRDAESNRILGMPNVDGAPFNFDDPGLRRQSAEDRLGQFRAPRADESGKADNLAGMESEAGIAEQRSAA